MSENRNTRVIAVGNQKGGCGKTATAIHLAAALGELGRKTLIWDLDANAGLTDAFRVPSVYGGTLELLLGEKDEEEEFCDPISYVIDETEEGISLPKGVSIIPASRELDNLEKHWLNSDRKFEDVRDALAEPLSKLNGHFDYIILDTGPNVSATTVAAYKSADWFLLVSQPEPLSINKLEAALSDIVTVKRRGNEKLRVLGIVLTCVIRRRALDRRMSRRLEQDYGEIEGLGVFDTTISRTTYLPRSQEHGRTMFQDHPDHEVCEQFRALARSVEDRIKKADGEPSKPATATPEQGRVGEGVAVA